MTETNEPSVDEGQPLGGAGGANQAGAGSENQPNNETQAGGQSEGQASGQTGAGTQGAAPNDSIDKVAALGHGVWLMSQVPTHKHFFIADLEWMLVPPVAVGQFRLWLEKTLPVGFATWAFLSEDAEKRIKEGGIRRLAPNDWKSGDRIWLMDLITPFGGRDEAVKEIKTQVFPGKTIKTLQPAPDGNGLITVEL